MTAAIHKRPGIGRADLVSVLAIADSVLRNRALAAFAEPIVEVPVLTSFPFDANPAHPAKPTKDDLLARDQTELSAVPFWRATGYEYFGTNDEPDDQTSVPAVAFEPRPFPPAECSLLSSQAELLSELRKHSKLSRSSRELDLEKIITRLGRGEQLESLPFRRRQAWGTELHVIVDESKRLTPYQFDQEAAIQWLLELYPKQSFEPIYCNERNLYKSGHRLPRAGVPILVLGDLGCLSVDASATLQRLWVDRARQFRDNGNPTLAIVPTVRSNIANELFDWWTIIPWGVGSSTLWSSLDRKGTLERLKIAVSQAMRLEPGLLRAVRRLLPTAQADPGWEAILWQDTLLSSRHQVAATLDVHQQEPFRSRFGELPDELQRQINDEFDRWHLTAFPLWRAISLASLPAASLAKLEGASAWAKTTLRKFGEAIQGQALGLSAAQWASETIQRTATCSIQDRELLQALMLSCERFFAEYPNAPVPQWYDPRYSTAAREAEFTLSVRMRGDRMELQRNSETSEGFAPSAAGSLLGTLRSRTGEAVMREVTLEEQRSSFWQSGSPPSWASAWGTDEFGSWAEFTVKDVTQRMRWISPGTFLMGSTQKDEDYYGDVRPQLSVSVTEGYWLFDTPCTQALWIVVMGGKNPSKFKGDRRPVEQVSYKDVVLFLSKINEQMPGLELQLPSEAQWEYSCRAGTKKLRYGPLENVAWYSKNSREQTHEVGLKRPNTWGLYDMLGNVYEWCQDGMNTEVELISLENSENSQIESKYRVIRGGSWSSESEFVSASYRSTSVHDDREYDLGFRCLSSGDGFQSTVQAKDRKRAGSGATDAIARILSPPIRISVKAQEPVSVSWPKHDRFELTSDIEQISYERLVKPNWATAIGRDRYGLWSEFQVKDVTQRMRWIPPGRFLMGSPAGEAGRLEDEGPQHVVTLTQGYWLFDTPCTQALWLAVLGGKNPSRFADPRRPVEQVSFEQAEAFLKKFNDLDLGFHLDLPTEAQWEYACRAGTTMATYAGELEIRGQHDAPVLDPIAWYGGNCGHDFDLAEGYDSTDWPDKQYEHTKAGTRQTGLKRANAWGLYDMLGNVWEWCLDGKCIYTDAAVVDPKGPTEGGAYRVVRGGSWRVIARYVRAASRVWYSPDDRDSSLGFRCLSSGEGVQGTGQGGDGKRAGSGATDASARKPKSKKSSPSSSPIDSESVKPSKKRK